jgi:hypothetical protein
LYPVFPLLGLVFPLRRVVLGPDFLLRPDFGRLRPIVLRGRAARGFGSHVGLTVKRHLRSIRMTTTMMMMSTTVPIPIYMINPSSPDVALWNFGFQLAFPQSVVPVRIPVTFRSAGGALPVIYPYLSPQTCGGPCAVSGVRPVLPVGLRPPGWGSATTSVQQA